MATRLAFLDRCQPSDPDPFLVLRVMGSLAFVSFGYAALKWANDWLRS